MFAEALIMFTSLKVSKGGEFTGSAVVVLVLCGARMYITDTTTTTSITRIAIIGIVLFCMLLLLFVTLSTLLFFGSFIICIKPPFSHQGHGQEYAGQEGLVRQPPQVEHSQVGALVALFVAAFVALLVAAFVEIEVVDVVEVDEVDDVVEVVVDVVDVVE